jgi:mannose-1-phosphate guanylyltransferase
MTKKNNFAVIMAGGVGSRFWPMSRENRPKQFLDVLGTGRTLIQMTIDRLKRVVPEDQIYVVTNQKYAALVKEQTGLSDDKILTEPMRRNTAPAIAYAAHKLYALNNEANLILAASDHLILKEDAFVEIANTALEKSAKGNTIVTLGIKPSRPDTGYGYIRFENEGGVKIGEVRKVKQFMEKPKLEVAEQFLKDGDYYWNSGIFIWKAANVIASLHEFKPELNALFTSKGNDYNTPNEQAFVNEAFTKSEDISIDFAVLEKAKNVYVVLADLGWSDLGTWGSLYAHLDKDQHGNAVVGNEAYLFDSSGCIVNLPDGKVALLQGLSDYIIVESNGILMVVKKEDEQKIKNYVAEIQKKNTGIS